METTKDAIKAVVRELVILNEAMIVLNENFSKYYSEWKKSQESHDKLAEQANAAMKLMKDGREMDKEVLETFKKSTKNISPEELQSILKSGPELVRVGKRMMEEQEREKKEWEQKKRERLKGI